MKNSLNRHQGEKGFVAIVPMLYGMAFLAIGFILYPILGLWGLLVVIACVLIGAYVWIGRMKSPNEMGKKDEK